MAKCETGGFYRNKCKRCGKLYLKGDPMEECIKNAPTTGRKVGAMRRGDA